MADSSILSGCSRNTSATLTPPNAGGRCEMRTDIKLGRVFGIQIGLHYSWFLIAFLIVLSVAHIWLWGKIMRFCIALNGGFFNTQRMLSQYISNAYSADCYR